MDRGFIPIPVGEDPDDLSDQDMEVLEEFGDAAGFLTRLDEKGLSRCALWHFILHGISLTPAAGARKRLCVCTN